MSFEAYMKSIRVRTGKGPDDFFELAVREGALGPATKPMEFVAWLKASSGLGHGHSMAIWEAFKRQGLVPVAPATTAGKRKAGDAAGGVRK